LEAVLHSTPTKTTHHPNKCNKSSSWRKQSGSVLHNP